MGAVREALYQPFASFENLAQIMHDLSLRNGTLLAEHKRMEFNLQSPTSECHADGPYSEACFRPPLDYAEEVVGAIACSDGPDQTNMTAIAFQEYWLRLRRESRYLGDRWARNRLMCVFWRMRPNMTYSGKLPAFSSELRARDS
jgi:hypothetical protein